MRSRSRSRLRKSRHCCKGNFTADTESDQIIAWETAAERIGQLLEEGSFASNVELAELQGFITEDEISDALIRWNGSFESKSRVNDYMLAHGRERGAAVGEGSASAWDSGE